MSGGPFSPKTTQANQTSNSLTSVATRNDNVSGNSGVTAVAGDGGVLNLAVSTTDAGAIAAGADIARAGLNTGISLGSQGIAAAVTSSALITQFADDASNLAAAQYHDAAQLVIDNSASTNATVKSLAEHSNDTIAAISQASEDKAYGFASDTLAQFGGALADYEQRSQVQLGNTVTALNNSYRDANTSSDQRIEDIAANAQTTVINVVKYAAIAAAAIAGLYLLARSAK